MTHPALARLQGDTLSIADKTKAIQQAAKHPPAAPAVGPATEPAAPARKLTPRTLAFRVEYENPVTGLVETHDVTSTVPMGDEHGLMARTAVAFAAGTPLDMMSAGDRRYFQGLGRCFVQVREPSDRVRELMLEYDFLDPLVGRLVEHERRFQLRGRSPSDGAPTKPSVVVHAPWDPDVVAG